MRRLFSPPTLLAGAIYFILTAVLTWPLVLHPNSVVPNDLGDSLLNIWLMAWNSRVFPLSAEWWNAAQFFPVHGAMAFSEHLLGLSVITTPIIRIGGSPLLAYNVAFFLSFPLSALSIHCLTYSIARRHDCALVSGIAFGFAPYKMAQFAHIQVLSAYWMPLALAGLHHYFQPSGATAPTGRFVLDGRARWLALFAGAWLMQALTCGYYLIYFSVLIGLWLLWFGIGRDKWRDVARVALAWLVAATLMVPVLSGYWTFQHAYGLRRWPDEIVAFSADAASILKAPDNLRLWGWLNVVERPESSLFPGVTLVLLVILGLWLASRTAASARIGRLRAARVLLGVALVFFAVAASCLFIGAWKVEVLGVRLLSVGAPHKPLSIGLLCLAVAGALHPSVRTAWHRRSALPFYALAAIAMWIFSLGPAPTLMNRPFIYKAPYAWLMLLPGVDGVRAPARFWMLAALCLAVAAGLAVRHVAARWPRFATALPVVASIGLLADSWPQAMQMPSPPDLRPIHTRAIARLELPITPPHDLVSLYRATAHQRPLFNGYSGYFAPHYWALQYLVEQHDPEVLTRISAFGPVEVVIDHDHDARGEWRTFVAGHPQAERVYQDASYSAYRIQRGARVGALPKAEGHPLPVASISAAANAARLPAMTDDDLVSRWDAGRAQRPGDSFTADLGQPREVSGAEVSLGGYVADFPRQLSIDLSVDGQSWTQVWNGGTALLTLSAALEDPLNVTLPFSFERRTARYIRFTQHGVEPTYYWSVAELKITGK
jgi:hypothetical protein